VVGHRDPKTLFTPGRVEVLSLYQQLKLRQEALEIPEEAFTACGALVFTTYANEKLIAEHLT
jgi:hypothetical protein